MDYTIIPIGKMEEGYILLADEKSLNGKDGISERIPVVEVCLKEKYISPPCMSYNQLKYSPWEELRDIKARKFYMERIKEVFDKRIIDEKITQVFKKIRFQ